MIGGEAESDGMEIGRVMGETKAALRMRWIAEDVKDELVLCERGKSSIEQLMDKNWGRGVDGGVCEVR